MTEVSYRWKNDVQSDMNSHEIIWMKSGNNDNLSLNRYEKSVSIKFQYASYGIKNTAQNISWNSDGNMTFNSIYELWKFHKMFVYKLCFLILN